MSDMANTNRTKPIAPCIHGDLCRAYMRKFGHIKVKTSLLDMWLDGPKSVMCIYSERCPECQFYEPKSAI